MSKDLVTIRLMVDSKGRDRHEIVGKIYKVEDALLEKEKVETFVVSVIEGDKVKNQAFKSDSLLLVKQALVRELQHAVNLIEHNRYSIKVIEDTHDLFQFREAHCKNCGKKLFEYYGVCLGIIKKCPGCRQLTSCNG